MVVAIAILVSQVAVNIAGVHLTTRINKIAAFSAELGRSIVLTRVLLVIAFIVHPVQSVGFLTTASVSSVKLPVAVLLSSLLAVWVLTGFEGAADLAEETHRARRNVPRAVVTSMCISAVLGFPMIVALTINVDNLKATNSTSVPIYHVLTTALGTSGAILFEAVVMVALYAGGPAGVAASSRLTFSMTRDGMFPGSPALAWTSPRTRAPVGSLIMFLILGVALLVLGTYVATHALVLIVGMAAVGYCTLYALTMVTVIWVVRQGPSAMLSASVFA